MRLKLFVMVAAVSVCFVLMCSCGRAENYEKEEPAKGYYETITAAAPTAEPTPEPTPEPVPPVPVDSDGNFEIYGKQFNVSDSYLILAKTEFTDNGELLTEIIPCMKNLEAVDLDSSNLSNERCAEIRDLFPDIEVIWRVNFGGSYSVRTNVTKILASMPSAGGIIKDESISVLKYCTKVRYLDLGHNDYITDFSFVENMPELEIAVISMTHPSTLAPFSKCGNLLYLEAGNCGLTDISPLAECNNLKHLNIGTNTGVTDISCIYNLDLLRLWLGNEISTSVPKEQMEEYRKLHPDCEVNETVGPFGEAYVLDGWKYWQQLNADDWQYYSYTGSFPMQRPMGYWKVAYKAFEYYKGGPAYAFSWYDPKYGGEFAEDTQPVNTFILNTDRLREKWTAPEYDKPEDLVPDELDTPPGEIICSGKY